MRYLASGERLDPGDFMGSWQLRSQFLATVSVDRHDEVALALVAYATGDGARLVEAWDTVCGPTWRP